MDAAKVKIGTVYRYRTPRGREGRGKAESIETKYNGAWVTLTDTKTKGSIKVMPAMLSSAK